MASINLYDVFNTKVRKFGVATSTNFQNSFIDAVNSAYADFNALVFHSETLGYLDSFDDIIDTRLASLTSMTFDSDCNAAVGGREFWGIEYEFERLSDTNGFTDTITLADTSTLTVTITDGSLTVAGTSINATIELPDIDVIKVYIFSNSDGNGILVNNESFTPDYDGISLLDIPDLDWIPDLDLVPSYDVGGSTTTQSIGTVSSHVINGVSGLELKAYRFYSAATMVLDFPLNDDSATVTDEVNAYTATVAGGTWTTNYVEPGSTLDKRYGVAFGYAIDYHLQNGGIWAIEPEQERERSWYGRGVQIARHIYKTSQSYTNPLGI